ncbi:MAG: biotin transporter BioY [candidate division Zixibacteria bacterium]|nr:biotin transporter BioY [candidate division Zixibacteria bacterium]
MIENNRSTAYALIKPDSIFREVPLLIGFNLILVLCSYISINLPFSPVPITGQTFGVLIIAMVLGKTRSVAVVTAYLLEGLAGLPVFAGGTAGLGVLMGPTGGYLLGFLAAAYFVGALADKGWDKNYLKSIIAMTIGTAIIFIFGLSWLIRFVPLETVSTIGFYPFIPGAILKLAVAGLILPSLWSFLDRK